MLDKLKGAIKDFEELQEKHSKFGATDTEPDAVFQLQLFKAAKGKLVHVPTKAISWQLYSGPGADEAARELAEECQRCVDIVSGVPLGRAQEVLEYLRDYCWRCCW